MIRSSAAALALSLCAAAAQAAPFSFDPVSFAGFANATFRKQGRPLFVKNLGTCLREGQDRSGYRCLSGELLEDLPARQGRNFCKLEAIWYVPRSRTVQLRSGACQFRSDRQRVIDQGQQLLRQGLEQLENNNR
jgi:hypothetical protein